MLSVSLLLVCFLIGCVDCSWTHLEGRKGSLFQLLSIKLTSTTGSNQNKIFDAVPIRCNIASECKFQISSFLPINQSTACVKAQLQNYFFFSMSQFLLHFICCCCTNFTLQNHSNDNVEQRIKKFAKEFELIVNTTQHMHYTTCAHNICNSLFFRSTRENTNNAFPMRADDYKRNRKKRQNKMKIKFYNLCHVLNYLCH